MQVKFTVQGKPQGKGRPRAGRTGGFTRIYTPPETVHYEKGIQACYLSQFPSFRFPKGTLLDLKVIAYYYIPQNISKKKRALMERGMLRPGKKPDADNILKIVADALNKVAYEDDAQIVDMQIRKFFSEEPRLEIYIQEVKA